MKSLFAISLLFLSSLAFAQSPAFNRNAFYKAMAMDSMNLVNNELNAIKTAPAKSKQAYEGALLMKKAGLASGPGKKLSLFKDGHKKLEAAIKTDSSNAEFRFLRLMIQEHAPGILGYKDELKSDSEFVQKSYKKLPEDVQHAVVDYSKKSKVLKVQVS